MKNIKGARIALVAAAIVTVAAGATGCSAGKADGGHSGSGSNAAPAQSKSEACSIVKKGFEELSSLQSDAMSSMSDPKKALEVFDKMTAKIEDVDGKVSNAEVKKATSGAVAAIDDYAAFIKSAVNDPSSVDTSKVSEKTSKLTEAFTEVGKVCA